jgi:hypothetical protein
MLRSFTLCSHLDVRLHTGRIRLRPSTIHREGVVYKIPANTEEMPGERHCNVSLVVVYLYALYSLTDALGREYRLDEKCGVSSKS